MQRSTRSLWKGLTLEQVPGKDLWTCKLQQFPGGICGVVKDPEWSRLSLKDCSPWKGTYIVTLVGDPPLEQLSPEELHPMEGTQDGVDCE